MLLTREQKSRVEAAAESLGVDPAEMVALAEQELAGAFGIQSIPSVLFIPMEGPPQMAVGALPKDAFQKAIHNILKIN